MSHTIEINKLGPIEHCKLQCSKFMVFTGMQASGKSTIAKAITFEEKARKRGAGVVK